MTLKQDYVETVKAIKLLEDKRISELNALKEVIGNLSDLENKRNFIYKSYEFERLNLEKELKKTKWKLTKDIENILVESIKKLQLNTYALSLNLNCLLNNEGNLISVSISGLIDINQYQLLKLQDEVEKYIFMTTKVTFILEAEENELVLTFKL